jgi:leucyl-tRNA synthetase
MKKYVLGMFPYPSGKLHMGHFRVYSLSDAIARMTHAFHPIGWDAFGLPAENAAIQHQMHPKEWTLQNIQHMKEQLLQFGVDFDWSAEFKTCDASYIRGTQSLFLLLFQHGLAYRKEARVYWDPVDKTVLANEQIVNGRAERSGALVEQKELLQWFFATTRYRSELLESLDGLDWPRRVVQQQQEWLAAKSVCRVPFWNAVVVHPQEPIHEECILVGPKHPSFVNSPVLVMNKWDMKRIESQPRRVYVTGAIQDEEAYVAQPHSVPLHRALFEKNGMDIPTRGEATFLETYGTQMESKLRDWLVSRQRSWGTLIPIVYCESCGVVPETRLPVLESGPCDCPKCGGPAQRETDTLDTFVDSSWYWLRFLDPNNEGWCDPQKARPVDVYVGGIEHAVMHLLYARFMTKVLADFGDVPFREPFLQLVTQGMVKAPTYSLEGRYVSDVVERDGAWYTSSGQCVLRTVEKMSKSKFNGVDPVSLVERYGSDVVRLYVLYRSAPQDDIVWEEKGIIGMQRFLDKVKRVVDRHVMHSHGRAVPMGTSLANSGLIDASQSHPHIGQKPHHLQESKAELDRIRDRVQRTMQTYQFHQSITWFMKWIQLLDKQPAHVMNVDAVKHLLKCLYPLAPRTTRDLYARFGEEIPVSDIRTTVQPPKERKGIDLSE